MKIYDRHYIEKLVEPLSPPPCLPDTHCLLSLKNTSSGSSSHDICDAISLLPFPTEFLVCLVTTETLVCFSELPKVLFDDCSATDGLSALLSYVRNTGSLYMLFLLFPLFCKNNGARTGMLAAMMTTLISTPMTRIKRATTGTEGVNVYNAYT
jgi:hypothetical protein